MNGLGMLVAIATGGALGALARYGLGRWIQQLTAGTFPWGTWVVNLLGSLFLGVVMRLSDGLPLDPLWRGFLAVGLAGGFTTFSTFSYEGLLLLQAGETARALAYLVGSVALGVVAVLVGFSAAGLLVRAPV